MFTDMRNMYGNLCHTAVEESGEINSNTAVEMKGEKQRKSDPQCGISILDLLQAKRHSYSHLFPLIDSSSYQIKAARSIYNRDELFASQELLSYFDKRCSVTDAFKDIHGSLSGSSNPTSSGNVSGASTSDEKQTQFERSHSDQRNCSATYLAQLYSRCMRMEREEAAAMRSMLLRRRSLPMEITESVSPMAFPCLPSRVVHPRSIWVGCIIDYMVISRRLNVRFVHTGDVFEDVVDGKLFAKVFLLPGRIQKQKVAVKRLHSKSYQRVCFEKFSGPELHTMAIGVKLYLSKGLLKKDQLLNEWTVRLSNVSLIGEHTVWQLFEWGL